MKTNKSVLYAAMTLALGSASLDTQAALVTDTVLAFDAGFLGCLPDPEVYCIINDYIYGSYFAMDTDGDGQFQFIERIPISPGYDGGIIIGRKQPPDIGPAVVLPGSGIDLPWQFFGNEGWHETTSPVTVANDYGTTKELDFSGWSVTWNSIPNIPMGGDTANFAGDTGLATITCSSATCSNSSTFVLTYSAHVPLGDPSGFGGVLYSLYLEGTISAVPVPAAAWLFGSGLLGLLGVARRKKAGLRA